MTPTSFTFLLTLPCDARFVPILRELAAQAVTYSEMDKAIGAGFIGKVEAAGQQALTHGPSGADTEVRFTCDGGELRVEFRGETVRQHVASA